MGMKTMHYAQMGDFIQAHGLGMLGLEGLQKAKNMFQLIRMRDSLTDVGDASLAQFRAVSKMVVDKRWREEHRKLA